MAELFNERWFDRIGQDLDVVISSRVRIARNLVDYPFPGKMGRDEETAVEAKVLSAVEKASSGELLALGLDDLPSLARRVFVEEGIISQPYSLEAFRRFAVSPDASLSAIPNDVEHLRLSAFAPGLDLAGPWARLDALDQALESDLPYAATFEAGYLTTELNSIGTGMRASVLLHLPALSETGLVEKAMKGLMSEGLGVRGYYGGEGQSSGALYQVSNTISLGDSEEGILSRVIEGSRRLVQYERMAREELAEKDSLRLQDIVARAYATLTHARIVSVAECFDLLSRFRLGVSLGWIEGASLQEIDGLYYRQQKARLQLDKAALQPNSQSADDTDRGLSMDGARASLLRAFAGRCRLQGAD